MNEDIVKNAVLYILERAENQEITIGKTRLIKLLYLLDIENYRTNQIPYISSQVQAEVLLLERRSGRFE